MDKKAKEAQSSPEKRQSPENGENQETAFLHPKDKAYFPYSQ